MELLNNQKQYRILPTKDITQITMSITSNKLYYSKTLELAQRHNEFEGAKFQYLYEVISNDTIDKSWLGKWTIYEGTIVEKFENWDQCLSGRQLIVASTDPNLELPSIMFEEIEKHLLKVNSLL